MQATVVDLPPSEEPTVRLLVPAGAVPAPRQHTERLVRPDLVVVSEESVEEVVEEPAAEAPAATQGRRWVDHLLTVAALLGVATTLFTVLVAHSGLRPLVVRSGSMAPTISTGAMVLVRDEPASAIRVGQVVSVERPDGVRVTHRVVSLTHRGATAELVLKGDANDDPDPQPVTVAHASRVVASIPVLGRVGSELTSARGGFVLGFVVAGVLGAVLRGRRT